MRQQTPWALSKIPVLYVDDTTDSGNPERLTTHAERTKEVFWGAASKLCPRHIGVAYSECVNCVFTLDFFSFFPQALYSLLERRYLIYIVDITAEEVPLNKWDDNAYASETQRFRDQLVQWFDLPPGALIDGEHHLIPAIWRLKHPLNPFVVWWSMAFEPRVAIESGVKVSHIARKGKDLDGVLASGLLWLTSQVPNCKDEPLSSSPRDGQADPFEHQFPVYIDFKNKRVRITTGVEISDTRGNKITSGLPRALGPSIVRNIQGGVERGLSLRYLIRGGRIRRRLTGKLLEANSETRTMRDQREKQYPDCLTVRKLLEKKVEMNGDYAIWNREIGVEAVSSVDLAWRHLYSAILHLYVHSFVAGDDLGRFDDTPLASDAQGHLTEHDVLATARAHIASAQMLGQDEFGEQSGDLEMLWVPGVVSLAIDIESGEDKDLATRLRKMRFEAPMIVDRMVQKDTKGLQFFKPWFSNSNGIYTILQSLWEIEEDRKESRELKLAIFDLYANAKSLHQQFSAER